MSTDQLTVKELMEKLKELPGSAKIWAWGHEGSSNAKVVGVFFDNEGVTSRVFIDSEQERR